MKNAKPLQCNSQRNRRQVVVSSLDTNTSVPNSTSRATRSGSTTRNSTGPSRTKHSNDDGISNSPSHYDEALSSLQPLHNTAVLEQNSIQNKTTLCTKRPLEVAESSAAPSSPSRVKNANNNTSANCHENFHPNSPSPKKRRQRAVKCIEGKDGIIACH